jgi:glyoxylase-like metal-dependent hydrolase (beta-lactamase superfamily II)
MQSNYPVEMDVIPPVKAFFDPATNTISYVVKDPGSNACAVVDSVMDIDYAAGRITYDHADQMIAYIEAENLDLQWLIETHVHADHLSAAPYIQSKLGGKIGIGENITVVQETFGKVFNEGTEFQRDGSQFDRLFKDGDTYKIGGLTAFVMHTPGHTPACMTHTMGNATFTGDTLFMPDGGSARADFPGGDAGILFDSIQKVLSLPECACLCAMIMGPMAAILSGKPLLARKKSTTFTWARANPRRISSSFAPSAMPSWICPS